MLQGKVQKLTQLLYWGEGMGVISFFSEFLWCVVLQLFFRAWVSRTLRTFAAFLVAVVLTVILPIANEAFVDAEAILAVVAGSGAKQRVCCCEGKTEQVTREASKSQREPPEPSPARSMSCSGRSQLI